MSRNLQYFKITLEGRNIAWSDVHKDMSSAARPGEDILITYLNAQMKSKFNKKTSIYALRKQWVDLLGDRFTARGRMCKHNLDKAENEKKALYDVLGQGHYGSAKNVKVSDDKCWIRKKVKLENHTSILNFASECYALLKFYTPLQRKIYIGVADSSSRVNTQNFYFYLPLIGYDTIGRACAPIKRKFNAKKPADYVRVSFKSLVDDVLRLHKEGVSHRDIKWDNILITFNQNEQHENILELIDYGLCLPDAKEYHQRIFSRRGTPQYMPFKCRGIYLTEKRGMGYLNTLIDTCEYIAGSRLAKPVPIKGALFNLMNRYCDFFALLMLLHGDLAQKQPANDNFKRLIGHVQLQGFKNTLDTNLKSLSKALHDPLNTWKLERCPLETRIFGITVVFQVHYHQLLLKLKRTFRQASPSAVNLEVLNVSISGELDRNESLATIEEMYGDSSANSLYSDKNSLYEESKHFEGDVFENGNGDAGSENIYQKFISNEVRGSQLLWNNVEGWGANSQKKQHMIQLHQFLNGIGNLSVLYVEDLFIYICKVSMKHRNLLGRGETTTGRHFLDIINTNNDYAKIKDEIKEPDPAKKANKEQPINITWKKFVAHVNNKTKPLERRNAADSRPKNSAMYNNKKVTELLKNMLKLNDQKASIVK